MCCKSKWGFFYYAKYCFSLIFLANSFSYMVIVYLYIQYCVSRGRETNQCLLWWDCVGVHLEMQLQQSASKMISGNLVYPWQTVNIAWKYYLTMSVYRYWYLGPLKTYAAHWFSTLRVGIHEKKKKSLSFLSFYEPLHMLPYFRNGLWSGIFQYTTWLPP